MIILLLLFNFLFGIIRFSVLFLFCDGIKYDSHYIYERTQKQCDGQHFKNKNLSCNPGPGAQIRTRRVLLLFTRPDTRHWDSTGPGWDVMGKWTFFKGKWEWKPYFIFRSSAGSKWKLYFSTKSSVFPKNFQFYNKIFSKYTRIFIWNPDSKIWTRGYSPPIRWKFILTGSLGIYITCGLQKMFQ